MTVVNFLIQFSVCYIQPINQIRPIVQTIFLPFENSILLHVILYASDVFFRGAWLGLIQIILHCFLFIGRHRSTISVVLCSKLLVHLYRNKFLIFWRAWWPWIVSTHLNIVLHRLTIQLSNFPFVYFDQINVIGIPAHIVLIVRFYNSEILCGIILLQTTFTGLIFWYFSCILLEIDKIRILELFSVQAVVVLFFCSS